MIFINIDIYLNINYVRGHTFYIFIVNTMKYYNNTKPEKKVKHKNNNDNDRII